MPLLLQKLNFERTAILYTVRSFNSNSTNCDLEWNVPLRGVMERGRADILVVDSAAFIKRYQLQNYCKKAVTIREVVAEIKDPQTRQSLQVLPYELEIKEPGHASVAHGEGGWPHSVARGEGGWPHSVARGEGGWPHSVARGEGGWPHSVARG